MLPFLVFDEIKYERPEGRNQYWDARVGCIDIAHIIGPRKGQRDYFTVRLCFEQERGKVDYNKDRQFKTFKEAKRYILIRFKKMIIALALNYDCVKWKQVQKNAIA